MKKLIVLALLMLFSVPAMATGLEIAPVAEARFFEDADDAVGAGMEVKVRDLIQNTDIIFTSGVVFTNTDANFTLFNASFPTAVDIVDWQNGVGYEVKISEHFTVTPLAKVHAMMIGADTGIDAENAVGASIGVDVVYDVKENVNVFCGISHLWAETEYGLSGATRDVTLDGFGARGGVSIEL